MDKSLKASIVKTKLGSMLAVGGEDFLYGLQFVNQQNADDRIKNWQEKFVANILFGDNKIISQIKYELENYFNGELINFQTPTSILGTSFQKKVWQNLREIPLGQTISYKELAYKIKNPSATRAVGNANGANDLAIIIPCHRVIKSDGSIGGYAGGIHKKQWLLNHEKKYKY